MVVAPAQVDAQSITWRIRHEYPFSLWLGFYSSNRNHSWPGGGQAYILNSWETQTITISCLTNEKVCYGAWAFTGRGSQYNYWGVGPKGRHGCVDCCHICDGRETQEILLSQ